MEELLKILTEALRGSDGAVNTEPLVRLRKALIELSHRKDFTKGGTAPLSHYETAFGHLAYKYNDLWNDELDEIGKELDSPQYVEV